MARLERAGYRFTVRMSSELGQGLAFNRNGAAMNEEFEAELDAVHKSHLKEIADQQREEDEWKAYKDEINAAFTRKCRTIIIPIFKKFGEYVKLAGWNSKIRLYHDEEVIPTDRGWKPYTHPTTGVVMTFFLGKDTSNDLNGIPYFALVCDYQEQHIFSHSSTMRPDSDGSMYRNSRIRLGDLTRREVNESLVGYFAQLLKTNK